MKEFHLTDANYYQTLNDILVLCGVGNKTIVAKNKPFLKHKPPNMEKKISVGFMMHSLVDSEDSHCPSEMF